MARGGDNLTSENGVVGMLQRRNRWYTVPATIQSDLRPQVNTPEIRHLYWRQPAMTPADYDALLHEIFHDLRNPLAVIAHAVELLRDELNEDMLSDDGRTILETLESYGARAIEMLDGYRARLDEQ